MKKSKSPKVLRTIFVITYVIIILLYSYLIIDGLITDHSGELWEGFGHFVLILFLSPSILYVLISYFILSYYDGTNLFTRILLIMCILIHITGWVSIKFM